MTRGECRASERPVSGAHGGRRAGGTKRRNTISDTEQKPQTRTSTILHTIDLTTLMPAAQTEHDVPTVRYDAEHPITATAWTQNKTTKKNLSERPVCVSRFERQIQCKSASLLDRHVRWNPVSKTFFFSNASFFFFLVDHIPQFFVLCRKG